MFYRMTSDTQCLSKSFATNETFSVQVSKWQKQLKRYIFQSFPKIRSKKRKFKEDDIGFLLEKRKRLKVAHDNSDNKRNIEIDNIEQEIASKIETRYAKQVEETLGNITADNGKINGAGVWKTVNNVFLKNKPQAPVAFEDKNGNLITSHEAINQFALKSMIERLRKRPIHPELTELIKLKTILTQLRFIKCKKTKTPKWTMEQLDKDIKSMKSKKCRDSYDIVNELFKPGIAGRDFKLSIL